MPTVMMDRPKMTRSMYHALKLHIVKEREKKKQAQEQDEALERMKKERELRKKKEEQDTLSLEQTKEHVAQLERKVEQLKVEKHELFSQLKKVLHQEAEDRKRIQLKEHSEMLNHNITQHYHQPTLPMPGHPMFVQHAAPMGTRPMKYVSHQTFMPPSMKRGRSPSPPPQSSGYVPGYPGGKYPPSVYGPVVVKSDPYPVASVYGKAIKTEGSTYSSPAGHVTYVGQPRHAYQPSSQPAQHLPQAAAAMYPSQAGVAAAAAAAASKYGVPPAGQSAFSSYPTHYAQHQTMADVSRYSPGYRMPRRPPPQTAYLMSPRTVAEHNAQQKHASGFDDKVRPMGMHMLSQQSQQQQQQAAMLAGQVAMSSASGQQGSIVTGYPMRTQTTASPYQTNAAQSLHGLTADKAVRHAFPGQPPSQYY